MTAKDFATAVVRQLRDAGHQAYWAGGCVRDLLWAIPPDDYDVATDARPERVRELFPRSIAVGVSFGVIEVLGPKPLSVQVATFRSDGTYSDGRHPDRVTYGDAREDALRRDFTINGLFLDPIDGRLIDYVQGKADLEAKILRAIGDPVERLTEDRLRVLRAVRFAARFTLAIEPATFAAIRDFAHRLSGVSAERISEELRKLLKHPTRSAGFDLMNAVGLTPVILPEADRSRRAVLSALPASATFETAMAAVLRATDQTTVHDLAGRLRLSNSERDRIAWLAEHRAKLTETVPRPSVLKPLLAHTGAAELLALNRAEAIAAGLEPRAIDECTRLHAEWPAEVVNPPPLLTGNDLMELGLKPGPRFRELLDAVRVGQLEGTIRDRAAALAYVRARSVAGFRLPNS